METQTETSDRQKKRFEKALGIDKRDYGFNKEIKAYCLYCQQEKSPINLCCCGGRCITDEDLKLLNERRKKQGIEVI